MDEVREMLQSRKLSRSKFLQITDGSGWNCLHWSAWHRDVECTRYILSLNELDVNAKDVSGRTVLHIALTPQTMFQDDRGLDVFRPDLPFELVKMLLDACNNDNVDTRPSEYAMMSMSHSFDVVKFLIDFGHLKGHCSGHFWHCAAINRRVDCMRYLLYTINQDPQIRNPMGWQACFVFFQNYLRDAAVLIRKETEFGVELLSVTCKSPAKTVEVFFLLIDCFRYKDYRNDSRAYDLFTKIVNLLLPNHPRQHLVKKLLQAKLPSEYCLITLTLFEGIEENIPNCKLDKMEKQRYLSYWQYLKFYFLQDLFALYLADESFCSEYIAEVKGMGWTFNEFELIAKLCAALTKETSMQTLFNFTKMLILHDFSFVYSIQPSTSLMSALVADHLLNVFVPLSNFIHAPIELTWIFGSVKHVCHYRFNETENCIKDYGKLLEGNCRNREVVSLKNLSRMSLRQYVFQRYTHFEALSILYLLDMPLQLRQYLCYNYSNLKF